MPQTVLAVASRAVVEGCVRLGIPAEELLAAAGLDRKELEDPDSRIAVAKADLLWQCAAERTRDPQLALHAAEGLSFGAFRVLDFLAANSPTVGDALLRIARYFPLVDPRARLELRVGDPTQLVMTARSGGELPAPGQEFTFAAIVTRVRRCTGVSWPLAAVEFSFPAPPDEGEHRRIFQAEVRFGCAEARLLASRTACELRVEQAQAELLHVLEDYADRRLEEVPTLPEEVQRVSDVLAAELREGRPEQASVARRLGTSVRTLQRQLKEEGTSFARVLDEVRSRQARSYLRSGRVSLAEIAFLLGFADQPAFTRAFRRWTGMTPRAWRRRSP